MDLGNSQHLTCANLHYNPDVTDPAELMEGTAGGLNLALSYPNLTNLIIRVFKTGVGRSVNLNVSDGVYKTWRCWIADNILGNQTSIMAFASVILIRNYKLQLLPRYGLGLMIITSLQLLTGGRMIMGAPVSLDGVMTCCMEAPGDWSVNMSDLTNAGDQNDQAGFVMQSCSDLIRRHKVFI
jgi:hypothetical protein